jgi:UDP-N-acetylglucosamine 2-epimerase (non-hydrolysing)
MRSIVIIVGARPNLVKAAALMKAMGEAPGIDAALVHTGQHYDDAMSAVFFRELGLPDPVANLGVGSGPHGKQTAQVMLALEPLLADMRPHCVMVVGDVNSTMAAALVAAKLHIPVAHVEAGLRSFDRTMPEEINRLVTDAVSDYLFTPSLDANENLLREGVPAEKIFFVGNVMIDTLQTSLPRAREARAAERHQLTPDGYAVLTLHRPSSVDDPDALRRIVDAIAVIQEQLPVIFPAHPRTVRMLESSGIAATLARLARTRVVEPLGYFEFLGLLADARLILTDSGGIQEEATALGVPCLTLRTNTERPVTITHGTNRLVGHETAHVVASAMEALEAPAHAAACPDLWDGRAAVRIVDILSRTLAASPSHV